jgi:hypothetical protein
VIYLPDYNREAVIDAVKQNECHVVGIVPSLLPYVTIEMIDDMVGSEFLCVNNYVEKGSPWKSIQEVYRIEGYSIVQSEMYQGWSHDCCLNKNGRFHSSMQVVDHDNRGKTIYAYERERKFKTLKEAQKVAVIGRDWIRVWAVACVYDQRREPHNAMEDRTPGIVKL